MAGPVQIGGRIKVTLTVTAALLSLTCLTMAATLPPATAQAGDCGSPPEVENGHHNGTGEAYPNLTTIYYTCDFAYIGTGYAFRKCLNGVWFGPPSYPFKCQLKTCPAPGGIANGERNGFVFSVGATVEYECNIGYKMKGRPVLQCMGSGNWDLKKPSCVPLTCPRLRPPAHGQVEQRSLEYQSTARISCDEGYTLTGPAERVCQRTERWSGYEENSCKEITCEVPVSDDLNVKVDTPVKYGYIAIFSCSPGKTLDGKVTSVCVGPNRWSPGIPSCIETCPVPTILHSKVEMWNTNIFSWSRYTAVTVDRISTGDSLYVSCDSNYRLKPPTRGQDRRQEITCESGAWASLPECEPNPCWQKPSPLYNGKTEYDSLAHGSRIVYICNPGYSLRQREKRVCQFGRWTGRKPTCIKNYCSPPSNLPAGSEVKDDRNPSRYGHGAKLTPQCRQGYLPSGPDDVAQWTCFDTIWQVSGNLQCERQPCMYTANRFEVIRNVKRGTSEKFPDGSKIQITCKTKGRYNLVNNIDEATCDAGEWKPRRPTCGPASCALLETTTGLQFTYSNDDTVRLTQRVPHNTTATVLCEQGYTAKGSPRCLDGKWVGTEQLCEPENCFYKASPFEEINNGDSGADGQFPHDSKIRISCKRKKRFFLKDGIEEATCDAGEWKPRRPTCQPAPCQLLDPVDNGHLTYANDDSVRRQQKVPHNTSATLVCDDGYEPKGRPRCVYGNWTGPKFSCEPASCPGVDDKGVSQSEGTKHTGIVKVSCNEGYHIGEIPSGGELRRSITAQCWLGKYIPMSPECRPDPCELPALQNVTVCRKDNRCDEVMSIDHGQNVRLRCMRGYKPENESVDITNQEVSCQFGKRSEFTEFTCIQDESGCPDPGEVENARRIEGSPKAGRFQHDDMLMYECFKGFHVNGEDTQTAWCNSNGTWDRQPVGCSVRLCEKPGHVSGGNVVPYQDRYSYNDTVTIKCRGERELIGSEVLICGEGGQWNDSIPTCQVSEELKCRVLDDDSGVTAEYYTAEDEVKDGVKPGDMVSEGSKVWSVCSSSEDVTATGDSTRVCKQGKWTGEEFKCDVKVSGCVVEAYDKHVRSVYRDPEGKIVSVTAGDSVANGSEVWSSCDSSTGRELKVDPSRKCDEGQWTGEVPRCYGSCEVMPPGEHVRVYYYGWIDDKPKRLTVNPGDRVPDGTSWTSFCKRSRHLTGDKTRVCKQGQWGGVEAKCSVRCKVLTPANHVTYFYNHNGNRLNEHSTDTVPEGTELRSVCGGSRHMTEGDNRRVCTAGGWSGTEPRCEGGISEDHSSDNGEDEGINGNNNGDAEEDNSEDSAVTNTNTDGDKDVNGNRDEAEDSVRNNGGTGEDKSGGQSVQDSDENDSDSHGDNQDDDIGDIGGNEDAGDDNGDSDSLEDTDGDGGDSDSHEDTGGDGGDSDSLEDTDGDNGDSDSNEDKDGDGGDSDSNDNDNDGGGKGDDDLSGDE